MKKIMILPLAALLMTACGDKEKEGDNDSKKLSICDCKKLTEEWKEKMLLAKDATDTEKIKEEFKDQFDACDKLYAELIEGLEGEELEAKHIEIQIEHDECN